MRAAVADLVDVRYRKPLLGQGSGGAGGGDQREAHFDELPAGLDQRALVLVAHRYKHLTLKRQVGAAAKL